MRAVGATTMYNLNSLNKSLLPDDHYLHRKNLHVKIKSLNRPLQYACDQWQQERPDIDRLEGDWINYG
ncbi:hypothetical protein PPNK14_06720 [Pectobacterium parmentieri]